MRIVLLDFALSPSPRVEESARAACRLSAVPGVAVTLVCPRASGDAARPLVGDDVEVVTFRGGYGHYLWLLKLIPLLRRYPEAVLLATGRTAGRAAGWAVRFVSDLPVVWRVRGGRLLKPLSLLEQRRIRAVCAVAARVCVPTQELADVVQSLQNGSQSEPHSERRDERLVVCGPCAEPEAMPDALLEACAERTERVIFLAADTLCPESGLSDLVDAMALVQGMDDLPPWEVRIVGDGPDFAELLEKARGLEVEAHLALLGDQPLPPQIAMSHVVISPARESREAHGRVFAAWAAERTLICTGTPELRECVTDKENALMVPPGNAVALGAAMVRCLLEPELAARLAEAGRASLPAHSPEVQAARLADICTEARTMARELAAQKNKQTASTSEKTSQVHEASPSDENRLSDETRLSDEVALPDEKSQFDAATASPAADLPEKEAAGKEISSS